MIKYLFFKGYDNKGNVSIITKIRWYLRRNKTPMIFRGDIDKYQHMLLNRKWYEQKWYIHDRVYTINDLNNFTEEFIKEFKKL